MAMNLSRIVGVLGIFATVASSQHARPDRNAESRTAAEMEAIEHEIDRAIVRRDTATLTTKLATSFTRIHTLGPVEDRDVFIKRIAEETRWSGSKPVAPPSSM